MGTVLIRPIVLAVVTGLLYTLSLPNFNLGPLAWVTLLPLHVAIDGMTRRRAFWIGWLAGTTAFVGSMFWVITAMTLYGKVPVIISFALMVLLSAYLGLYVALYALGVQVIGGRGALKAPLCAPFLWVALEWVRTHLFSGLPWSLLGYSQYTWLPAIQIADITAVYGVSFVIVLVNVGLAEAGLWLLRRNRNTPTGPFPWLTPTTAAIVLVLSLAYGQARLTTFAASVQQAGSSGHFITIGLVQANIDQSVKWDASYLRATQDRYSRLTAQAAVNADLVVWPEAATPYFFEAEPDYREEISALVRASGAPLLFGSPTLGYYPNRRPYLMNSAYLLSTDARVLGRYSKRHLVPFGEYIPLHDSVLFFLDKLVEGIGDFKAGTEATLFPVPPRTTATSNAERQPASEAFLRFGVVICYEVIFPNEVREFAAGGADFMVTITNDAWFGRSSAPYQHFGMVVLRAVENRLSFARAANTGISGFIDPTGRILQATPVFSEAAISGKIPIGRTPTFYSRHGDVFAYACVIISAVLLVGARWRDEQGRGRHRKRGAKGKDHA
jgi:apolipoprotein N-acyltransferase